MDKQEQSIFVEALELDRDERVAYLAAVCSESPELRARLDALLEAHDSAGGFMERAAVETDLAPHLPSSGGLGEGIDPIVGPYRLLKQIGEGGFGVVFLAEQTAPIRREVAVKIIKPGMDTRQVIARFEAERQVLALMDHPNIARVLDAGATNAGRPYFVMELVTGVPITDYCSANRLGIRDRLELLVTVCRAVEHAHQKGIIHRDLKPSNVLVARTDHKPVVKVIDFGVAKAIGDPQCERTVDARGQFVGTPLYISPEQATLTAADVDTRSDVYSLGALLYELLTGVTPFDRNRLNEAPFDEICRIIREEDPPAASARVAALDGARIEIASLPAADVRKLRVTLRGELDWIVTKAMDKDRNRRYGTAAALAEDCERFLRHEAIMAHPPSTLYRLRKLSRRYKLALSTVAMIATAFVVGGGLAAWEAVRATRAEAVAERSLSAQTEARKEADAARRLAEANFQQAQKVVDEYFTRVSESQLLDVPGLQPLRKNLLSAAKNYYEQFVGQTGADPDVRAALAAGNFRLAQISNALDDNDNAVQFLKQGLDLVEELEAGGVPPSVIARRVGGVYAGGRGLHRGTREPSDPEQALGALRRGVAVWTRFVGADPANHSLRNDLAGFHLVLGNLLRGMRRLDAALDSLGTAQELWTGLRRESPDDPEYAASLARCYGLTSDVDRRQGREAECAAAFATMVDLEESLVREHPKVPEYRLELALALTEGGRSALDVDDVEKSKAMLPRARRLLEALAEESPSTPVYLESLAITCATQSELERRTGHLEQAEVHLRRGLARLEMLVQLFPKLTRYRQELAGDYRNSAILLLAAGHGTDAEAAYRMALDNFEQLTVEEPRDSDHARQFAWALAASPFPRLQDGDRAIATAERAVRLAPRDPRCRETLGVAQCRSGRFGNAVKSLRASIDLSPADDGFRSLYLAIASQKLGKVEDARAFYERAVGWVRAKGPHNSELDRLVTEAQETLRGSLPGRAEGASAGASQRK